MDKFKDVGKGKQDRSSEARQQGKDTTLDLIWRTKSGGMWWGTPQGSPPILLKCKYHAVSKEERAAWGKNKTRNQTKQKTENNPLAYTHLEKVILMHDTAVGQSLDQVICQSGFTTISHPVNTKAQGDKNARYHHSKINDLPLALWQRVFMHYIELC